jgi:FKBP12-rapamycin complex-associated protein
MNVCLPTGALLIQDLRPLLTCNETVVMLAAAKVVGNMIGIAGATLGESFFVKEIGQSIQLLEGGSSWRGKG